MGIKKVEVFESAESIEVLRIGADDCLLKFAGDRILLSYEATYDLAIRLAAFIQRTGEMESNWPTAIN